jgi:hypothetical protein
MEFITGERLWYDIMAEEEHRMATRLLRMTAAEWKEEGNRILRAWRGRDIRSCIAYLNRVDRQRADYAAEMARPVPVVVRRPRSEFDVDFAMWRDMIEEPAKYGDDICDWLALDDKLTRGSGRWRLGAYWTELQAEEDAKAEALVAPWRNLYTQCAKEAAKAGDLAWIRRDIKRHVARFRAEALARETLRNNAAACIQAAVRGHQARNAQPFRDCCMCLSHRISPLQTGVGMMCRGCAEQGPYEDITGPVADEWNWFRADYVDLAPGAEDFDPASVIPYPTCSWCTAPLDEDQIAFCDRDCKYSYMKEEWRESRRYD